MGDTQHLYVFGRTPSTQSKRFHMVELKIAPLRTPLAFGVFEFTLMIGMSDDGTFNLDRNVTSAGIRINAAFLRRPEADPRFLDSFSQLKEIKYVIVKTG